MINVKTVGDPNIIISDQKLTDYLLSTTHMIGRTKAKFFRGLGYHAGNLDLFKRHLANIALRGIIQEEMTTPYGKKLIVQDLIKTPNGKSAKIKTVWMVDQKRSLHFVTAYPA